MARFCSQTKPKVSTFSCEIAERRAAYERQPWCGRFADIKCRLPLAC